MKRIIILVLSLICLNVHANDYAVPGEDVVPCVDTGRLMPMTNITIKDCRLPNTPGKIRFVYIDPQTGEQKVGDMAGTLQVGCLGDGICTDQGSNYAGRAPMGGYLLTNGFYMDGQVARRVNTQPPVAQPEEEEEEEEDGDVTMSRTFKAWCNPQADDDCYIDDKRVKIKDLSKVIPVIDGTQRSDVRCDTHFCYDNDGPIGVNKELVDRHAND